VSVRVFFTSLIVALAAAAIVPPHARAQRAAAPYTVVTSDGRRSITASAIGDQDMLRLDEIAAALQLTVREDRAANALTVSRGLNVVILSLDQPLASTGGRVISLPAAPVRDGSRWLVPPDAVGRAFGAIAGMRVEVRKASRLILVGDVRVPRVVVRQEQSGAASRVTIDISPRAAYTIVQEPRQLLVRFEADGLDAGAGAAGGGMVDGVTFAEPATIAIALDKGFGSYRSATVPLDAASSRLVIDLMAAGAPPPQPATGLARAQPQTANPFEAPPAEAPIALPPPPAAGIRTIVIDPGHGGDEEGARGSAGLVEKDVALDVARRLKGQIEGRLGIRVLLTRDEDRLVPHDERASIANNNKADLFVSLHANSSPNRSAKGAEVFYLSLDGLDAEARKLAENPETRPVPILGGGSRDLDLILWDMAQARHLAESSAFAVTVEEELRRHVEMSPNPIQQAPFRVLVAANMPAVLVEMAFLSNPDEERLLASDEFKNRIVQALYDAIVRYRARVEAQAAGRRP
jgi:N-acetylmuramoyl-L-alanine amidase